MSITVKKELYVPRSACAAAEWRHMKYVSPTGLTRQETRGIQSQSDTTDYTESRLSYDNGKTWGEWARTQKATKIPTGIGADEYQCGEVPAAVWNPVHGHYVALRYQRMYLDGYEAATKQYWNGGGMIDHTFLEIRNENGETVKSQMLTYEDGESDFRIETYRTEAYTDRNLGIGETIAVLRNGDILVELSPPMSHLCRLTGLDCNQIFPSIPRSAGSMLIMRGVWSEEKQTYELSAPTPVYIDDRISSRGTAEPTIAELASGRILLIFRISNMRVDRWNSRISPYAPSYKMYCLSDDGGKTFSPPMPWHFDTREVVYSSSTYSVLLRSQANGRLYWIGNITDPTKNNGNWPRYPLHIVEVDDEWGVAKKETLTEIDTRMEEETEQVQLSNFNIIQDRESANLELYLAKLGQFPDCIRWDCETWKYTITLPE